MLRVAAALSLVLHAAPAEAEPVVLKLATMAPAGSAWHQRLRELSERWSERSGGQVKLRIFPGGVQGGEGDMLRKIGIGQLDAASVTNVGLHDVAPEPQAVTVPLLFRDGRELAQVFARVQPRIDEALLAKGLVPLHWAQVGQVRFFCARPYRTPGEMASARVFAWEGDPASAEVWRAAGLRPVVLSSVDLVPALQTGMIDCVAHVPAYVLSMRLYEKLRYMVDVPWGQVMGATVISRRSWERVPAELRPRLAEAAREVGRRVDEEARAADQGAIAAMHNQGLTVLEVAPAPWQEMGRASWPMVRGKVVPAALFDEVMQLRDEARRQALVGASKP